MYLRATMKKEGHDRITFRVENFTFPCLNHDI